MCGVEDLSMIRCTNITDEELEQSFIPSDPTERRKVLAPITSFRCWGWPLFNNTRKDSSSRLYSSSQVYYGNNDGEFEEDYVQPQATVFMSDARTRFICQCTNLTRLVLPTSRWTSSAAIQQLQTISESCTLLSHIYMQSSLFTLQALQLLLSGFPSLMVSVVVVLYFFCITFILRHGLLPTSLGCG